MKKIFISFILIIICFLITTPSVTAALNFGDAQGQLEATAGAANVSTGVSMESFAAVIIQTILGLVGLIFFIMIIYGGFLWMTAQGKDEQIKKARKLIINAVIGIIIVGTAYSVAYFITTTIEEGPASIDSSTDTTTDQIGGGAPIID